MSEEKERVIKDLKWFIQNNDFNRSGIETSSINRVLGGILSTPGDAAIEGLAGLYGTNLANAGANLESRILSGLRVLPGDNVHHIVPLGLLRDALKDHPLSVQEEVLKRVEDEFGVQTGNSKRNLESILEFTHVFAGDKAAHPDGDTVQRYLRPTPLPPGASSKEIFSSIKQSLNTAINQYKNAVAPGTVEAARRQNVVDKFTNTFGVKVDPFQLESDELKGVIDALKISRSEAPNLDSRSFTKNVQNGFLQELANDPLGARFSEVTRDQYSRFNDFLNRRTIQAETGFKHGFRDLQPAAPPFGERAESSNFKRNVAAWLAANGLEPNKTNNSLAKKALQADFNANLLRIQNSGAVTSSRSAPPPPAKAAKAAVPSVSGGLMPNPSVTRGRVAVAAATRKTTPKPVVLRSTVSKPPAPAPMPRTRRPAATKPAPNGSRGKPPSTPAVQPMQRVAQLGNRGAIDRQTNGTIGDIPGMGMFQSQMRLAD